MRNTRLFLGNTFAVVLLAGMFTLVGCTSTITGPKSQEAVQHAPDEEKVNTKEDSEYEKNNEDEDDDQYYSRI